MPKLNWHLVTKKRSNSTQGLPSGKNDGHEPGNAHGIDVDEQGKGIAAEQRMYQLIRQPAPIVDRQFEVEFLAVAEAFSFTFG
jgi:Thioredoxin like C-terminal domain